MLGFTVTEEQTKALSDAVGDVLVQTEAMAVFVCERSGNILARTPTPDDMDSDTVAALAAGATAATQEMARHIREEGFDAIAHQGADRSIYIQVIREHFLVLTIFDASTTLGLVKLYISRMAERIDPILEAIAHGDTSSAGASFEFSVDGDLFSPATTSQP